MDESAGLQETSPVHVHALEFFFQIHAVSSICVALYLVTDYVELNEPSVENPTRKGYEGLRTELASEIQWVCSGWRSWAWWLRGLRSGIIVPARSGAISHVARKQGQWTCLSLVHHLFRLVFAL